MKLNKLEQLSKPLTEATRPTGDYKDSADFTDEFYGIMSDIQELKKIMKSPRWLRWMSSTDENFNTSTVKHAKEAIFALSKMEESLNKIDTEFDSVN